MQLVGWPTAAAGPPPPGAFTALFVHTDAAIVGHFNSSNQVLTAVMRAALMSERRCAVRGFAWVRDVVWAGH